jgi:hypothetical protein
MAAVLKQYRDGIDETIRSEDERMESSDKLTDKQAGPATTGSGVQIDRSKIVEVPIDQIRSSKLMLRPVDENYVDEISKSMASIGQLEAILVRPLVGGGFEVVDGHHRLLATKKEETRYVKHGIRPVTGIFTVYVLGQ